MKQNGVARRAIEARGFRVVEEGGGGWAVGGISYDNTLGYQLGDRNTVRLELCGEKGIFL